MGIPEKTFFIGSLNFFLPGYIAVSKWLFSQNVLFVMRWTKMHLRVCVSVIVVKKGALYGKGAKLRTDGVFSKCSSFKVEANYAWTLSLTLMFVNLYLIFTHWLTYDLIEKSLPINLLHLNVGNHDIFVPLLLTLTRFKTLHQRLFSWPGTFRWEWSIMTFGQDFFKKKISDS